VTADDVTRGADPEIRGCSSARRRPGACLVAEDAPAGWRQACRRGSGAVSR
jgi:beta-phosphoglucomutase-like phosphatase (HAD superfamily)